MAITKAKKGEILAKLADIVKSAETLAFVAFSGLTVHEASEMRRTLKGDSVKYLVVKKTLLKKTLTERGYKGTMPDLPGEIAMAYAGADVDSTAPLRGLQAFIKKFAGKLAFVGGAFEGKFLSKEEAVGIATIPPVQVLRGMFVNIINSPIQRFAIALGEVSKKKV